MLTAVVAWAAGLICARKLVVRLARAPLHVLFRCLFPSELAVAGAVRPTDYAVYVLLSNQGYGFWIVLASFVVV